MFLGAMAPLLGVEEELAALPDKLGLKASISFDNVMKCSIQCRKARVVDLENPAARTR